MSSILISSDGSDITNNNTITFANTPNSTYFTEIDTGYTMFSGELSLTTTNDKNVNINYPLLFSEKYHERYYQLQQNLPMIL